MDLKEILFEFYKQYGTHELADMFKRYMQSLGAKKIDRRKTDNANTYVIDGDTTCWNKVECYYFKNAGDYAEYGKFNFSLVLRKRMGDYILIEVGSEEGEISRIIEFSYGKLVERNYNKELCEKFMKEHGALISMMLCKVYAGKKFRCKKTFSVELYDDDGFSTDTYKNIEAGTVWTVDDSDTRMVGAIDTIRLENDDNGWIELTKETVDEYFEQEN